MRGGGGGGGWIDPVVTYMSLEGFTEAQLKDKEGKRGKGDEREGGRGRGKASGGFYTLSKGHSSADGA